MTNDRIIIRTSDIAILTGVTATTASRNMRTIKDSLGKTRNQKITIKEYSEYSGISESEIKQKLKL